MTSPLGNNKRTSIHFPDGILDLDYNEVKRVSIARAEVIADLRAQGKTFQFIADQYGISKERVRQIIKTKHIRDMKTRGV